MIPTLHATDKSRAKDAERSPALAVVVIGRNEGQRLAQCLSSLGPSAPYTIYVDSGSTDGSPQLAQRMQAQVVNLDLSEPFTAGRARNAGYRAAMAHWPDVSFIQFVDGECTLDPDWLTSAHEFMVVHPNVAVVFGRRRERYIERSVFNALCDREWDGKPGSTLECGGDSLMRTAALRDSGPFASTLIAGEEPELCVRLRAKGWRIWRLDAEMTRHDANITSLRQWWRRSTRSGYAFAEVSTCHWSSPFGIWKRSLLRSLGWGGLLPLAAVAGWTLHPAAIALLGLYPIQIARIARREGWTRKESWRNAFFDMFGKFAEFIGVTKFFRNRMLGRRQAIIEYK